MITSFRRESRPRRRFGAASRRGATGRANPLIQRGRARGPVLFPRASMAIAAGIFRQYDIRGIVGKDLTAEAARAIGGAYAAYHARSTASAARSSSAATIGRAATTLRDALVDGLTSAGVDVIDIGVVPTPLNYWALHHLPVVGGIQITGSHNPPEYNGFKLSLGNGVDARREIQHLYALTQQPRRRPPREGQRARRGGDRSLHRRRRRSASGRSRGRCEIVYDCGNGAGALVAPQLFERARRAEPRTVLRERRHLPESSSRSDRPRESRGPHRGGEGRRRRDRHRVRRRRGPHRRRRRQGRHHLGRSHPHSLRARRARAHGPRPADHLRREVLAGAARRRSRRPAASP